MGAGLEPWSLLVLAYVSSASPQEGSGEPPGQRAVRTGKQLVHPHPHPHLKHTHLMMAPLKTLHPIPHSLNPLYLSHKKTTPTPR